MMRHRDDGDTACRNDTDGTWEHTPPEVRPGPLVGTMATGVVHLSAEVDNGPRPDSGSGGA
ncbi:MULTISPECIES: hypothetical protein [unclassified Nocardia]|uniref:hypothetical protein n=1 Tax=unclassified Nocardia TaxID=2637762 RepID=UPI0033BC20AF